MKILPFLVLAFASGPAFSEGLPAFDAPAFPRIDARQFAVHSPRPEAGDVLTSYHMIAQAGSDAVFGYADNEADASEATAYWSAVLKSAGVQPGAPTFSDGMYRIPYKTSDGRTIRGFLADSRQFPPKDEAGLRANLALAQDALAKDGLTVVSARILNVDALLPTYAILYLTKPAARPEDETRMRLLKAGDDVDFDVYRGAGVDVVQTPKAWMMVYVGPEVGFVGLIAKTADELDVKVAKRRELLVGQSKKIIGERHLASGEPDFPFAASLYFFQ